MVNKIFSNKKRIILFLSIILISIVGLGIKYILYYPSSINRYIASNIYKSPANTSFKDQNFYNCVIDQYNYDNGTSLSYTTNLTNAQLAKITFLFCYEKNISDASGVEKLTALKGLYADSNQLTSLDVSKNTALESLWVDENQLTSLNLSNLKLLNEVNVAIGNNPINSLILNGTADLSKLKVYTTAESLIISGNTNQTEIDISGYNLTNLTLSSGVQVKKLYSKKSGSDVPTPKLTNVDLRYNTSLTNLDLSNSNISSIDLSKNTSLIGLNLRGNKLTNIDLSKNTKIQFLYLNDNSFSHIDLKNNTLLSDLNILNNKFVQDLGYLFVGESIDIPTSNNYVELPTTFEVQPSNNLSSGLELNNNRLKAISVGTNSYDITYTNNSKDIYTESFTVNVINITSTKYNIDKNNMTISVGRDDDETVLKNLTVTEGYSLSINDGKLVISDNDTTVKEFTLVYTNITSNKYDVSKDYIYVGVDSDEEILENIVTDSDKNITNNILIVGDLSFNLVRINTTYDISGEYLFTLDNNETLLSKISVINGDKKISNNSLIISYNNTILKTIPIKGIYSDKYEIKDNYIYVGLGNFNEDYITKVGVSIAVDNNILSVSYNNEVITTFNIYNISINNNDISINDSNKLMTINYNVSINDIKNSITGSLDYSITDSNNNEVTSISNGNKFNIIFNDEIVDSYTINLVETYIDYGNLEIENYSEDNIGIIKNLSIDNSFENILSNINKSDNITLTIKDKDNNLITNNSNKIKTGDRLLVTYPDYEVIMNLSVLGDVTGTGVIDNSDVIEGYNILKGTKKEDCYKKAVDVVYDNNLKINDIAKLYQYTKNVISDIK